ncbi:integrase catalytic domain-containing protein [Rhodococcus artemisiae]|uniref:integrase catalytic domain-containing protein n=1 Tax=Rhodococcus artemisiae TaxID=714159 RepID=UPI0038B6905D
MSAATIDHRLAEDRRRLDPKGRAHTKPGSGARVTDPDPHVGAVGRRGARGTRKIDLVGHEGGNAVGDHAYTLTVTDIATGAAVNRSVPNKARKWVLAALEEIAGILPFPIRGVDSDNGSEFINHHLLAWCAQRQITFTRSRPGNSNDGAHVEQKNWAIVRTVVGYHRYDTSAELLVLNDIWVLQSSLSNFFCPQQKLISKVRDGAKVTKKYDTATTPHRRVERHDAVTAEDKAILADTYVTLNPAAIQRQIQALTAELLTLTTAKAGPGRTPIIRHLIVLRAHRLSAAQHARLLRLRHDTGLYLILVWHSRDPLSPRLERSVGVRHHITDDLAAVTVRLARPRRYTRTPMDSPELPTVPGSDHATFLLDPARRGRGTFACQLRARRRRLPPGCRDGLSTVDRLRPGSRSGPADARLPAGAAVPPAHALRHDAPRSGPSLACHRRPLPIPR